MQKKFILPAAVLMLTALEDNSEARLPEKNIYELVRSIDTECGAQAVLHENVLTARGDLERILIESGGNTACINGVLQGKSVPDQCGMVSLSRLIGSEGASLDPNVEVICNDSNNC